MMECPHCRTRNREGAKFCEECGARINMECPQCRTLIPLGRKFCGECGCKLPESPGDAAVAAFQGERKQITVLFTDLTGYTAMSEKMDPEEVKEILSMIFGEIAQVATRYDGYLEKFIGDEAMILFGTPKAHEDDPVRAIRAAQEIHQAVEKMNARYEKAAGRPLSMHSGINTGLVVIDEMLPDKGGFEVTGETVNLASRLCDMAQPGEILAGPDTYRQAEGYFTFQSFGPVEIYGKSEPIQVFRLLSPKATPQRRIRRRQALLSELVGRGVELAQLQEAVHRLRQGVGTVVSVCGEAGSGKTRLVEEFRNTLPAGEIRWMECQCYPYSQNTPYWPLIDLLNRIWRIDEEDSPERVREKIKAGVESLAGRRGLLCSLLGSLYTLSDPKIDTLSPEVWKSWLYEAVQSLLVAQAQRELSVFCLEDLHWADPSFLELLRFIVSKFNIPAVLLLIHRPPFNLFNAGSPSSPNAFYREIHIGELSASEARQVVESLLKSEDVPLPLIRFIQQVAGGNPLYVEEMVNSLVESKALARSDGRWELTRPLTESTVSPTIQGVMAARMDLLDREVKRVIQEAAVIGRAFFYRILEKITDLKSRLNTSLNGLERIDLIRVKSIEPELEYIFKHALTHEYVYTSLLNKERQALHERIAAVMEELFRDRMAEYYEALAFHYKQGGCFSKALEYLIKAGEKSLRRYSVEESHRYFKEAFDLLTSRGDEDESREDRLIDLLNRWSFVFYYSGNYRGLLELLESHKGLAESSVSRSQLGLFYGWLGCALWHRERPREARSHLMQSLKLGEEAGDSKVVGYACTWLTWASAELGRLDEALDFARKAQEVCSPENDDPYVYFNSLAGKGYVHWHRGDKREAFETGTALVHYGRKHSNVRSRVMGHCCTGFGHLIDGDIPQALASFEEAHRVSVDPWYSYFPKLARCYAMALSGKLEGIEETLREIVAFSEERGAEYIGTPARLLLGAVLAAGGRLKEGLNLLGESRRTWYENSNRLRCATSEYILGNLYAGLARKEGPPSASREASGGPVVPSLSKAEAAAKALEAFEKLVEMEKEMGARDLLGPAHLQLGLLHRALGHKEQAAKHLSLARGVFEECGAETHLERLGQYLPGGEGKVLS